MTVTATPSRRRLVVIVLLLLAVAGAVIRMVAPDPSTLRDVGSLLLVMWFPVVGNVIVYLMRKIPRRTPPAPDFAADAAFVPQLQVQLEPVALSADRISALDPHVRRCTVLVGRQGFTTRLAQPVAQLLESPGPQSLALEFLRPEVALPKLPPGTEFYLLMGTMAVAKGRV